MMIWWYDAKLKMHRNQSTKTVWFAFHMLDMMVQSRRKYGCGLLFGYSDIYWPILCVPLSQAVRNRIQLCIRMRCKDDLAREVLILAVEQQLVSADLEKLIWWAWHGLSFRDTIPTLLVVSGGSKSTALEKRNTNRPHQGLQHQKVHSLWWHLHTFVLININSSSSVKYQLHGPAIPKRHPTCNGKSRWFQRPAWGSMAPLCYFHHLDLVHKAQHLP